jgi:hypothetical protein
LRNTFSGLILLAAWLTAVDAFAQTGQTADGPDPATVRMRIGPLGVTPRFELTNFGVDTNVFNEPTDADPKEDVTATFTPSVDLWLRMGRSWLQSYMR